MLRLHPILIVAVTALLPVENAAAQSYTIPSEPANPTSDAQCNSMGEQFRTIREMLLEEARKLGDQAWEIAKKTTLDSYTAAKPYYDEAKQNRDAANSILTRASRAHRECLRKVRANKSASDEDIDNIFNQVGDLADEANPGNTYGQSLSGAMFDASMNELSEHYKDLFQRLDQMKADLAKVNSEIVAAARLDRLPMSIIQVTCNGWRKRLAAPTKLQSIVLAMRILTIQVI